MRVAKSVWRGISQQGAPLERAAAQLERERIAASGEVVFGQLEYSTRGRAHFASGRIGSAGQSLRFEAACIGHRISLGLFDEDGDDLVGMAARRILRVDRNAVENSQVIKPALRLHHVAFAQWFVRLHAHLAANPPRTRVIVTADKNSPDARLRPFFDVIHEADWLTRRDSALALLLGF